MASALKGRHPCNDKEPQHPTYAILNLATLDSSCINLLSSISDLLCQTRRSASASAFPHTFPHTFPPISTLWQSLMASAASHRPIPGTPRVISPSRTPSEISLPGRDYFAPITRSVAKKSSRVSSSQPPSIPEHSADSSSDSEGRARNRSRSRDASVRLRRLSGLREVESRSIDGRPQEAVHKKPSQLALANSDTNGHLSPALAASKYWPEFSRSSSPLGLIPIHREWRSFVSLFTRSRSILTAAT